MIGKITKGAAFKGCVRYVTDKRDAKLLAAEGVLLQDRNSIIRSFITQAMMKPDIKHPVGHISLSYSPDDETRLTDKAMVILAKEYMQEMGIKDTQYIIMRHHDNGNPHVHLVYNRIDNNGKVISDKNDRYRNEAVCKKLKDKYSLSYGKGKEKVKQHRLRDKDKVKYETYSAIKAALSKSADWDSFERLLKEKGVTLSYKYKGQTKEVQGISFAKDGISFKGSEVDRSFSYSKIDAKLKANVEEQRQDNTIAKESNTQNQKADLVGSLIDGLGSLSTFQVHGDDPQEERFRHNMEYLQKKINRKNNRRPKLR